MNRFSSFDPVGNFARAKQAGLQNRLLTDQLNTQRDQKQQFNNQRELKALGMLGGIVESAPDELKAQAYMNGMDLLREQGLDTAGLPQEFNAEVLNKLSIGRQLAFQSGLLEKQAQKDTRTKERKLFDEIQADESGEFGQFVDRNNKSKATKIENNINNNSDLTKSQTTAQQKKILAAERDLVSLRKIKGRISPDLFNTWSRARDGLSSQAEKLGWERSKESVDFNRRLEAVITPVTQYFNRYRKEITGAAAAIQELEALKQSTINGELSYTQFVNRLDQIMEIAEADISVAKDALRGGIDLTDQPDSNSDPLGIL